MNDQNTLTNSANNSKSGHWELLKRQWKKVLTIVAVFSSLLLMTILYPEVDNITPNLQTEVHIPYLPGEVTDKSHVDGLNGNSRQGYYSYLNEEMALKEPPCKDPKLAPDPTFSRVYLTGSRHGVYELGMTIAVTIHLYNSYNQSISRGGSIIRARMYNLTKASFTAGVVVDHHNGTYTAYFQALWAGQSNIGVQIAYTPETIRIIYHLRHQLPNIYLLKATYQVSDVKERYPCHPTVEGLEYYGIKEFCNLTNDNSGMPWYCGKPQKVPLLCEDWLYTTNYPVKLPMTDCETAETQLIKQTIKQELKVNVRSGQRAGTSSSHVAFPTTPCFSYNRTLLWEKQRLTGFMYERKWYLHHCTGITQDKVLKCLENWKVVFFGDSTIRYWFKYILKNWNCTLITEKWTSKYWKKRSLCQNVAHNLAAEWRPHAQPFHGVQDKNRYTKTSISRHLDETGSEEKVIAIVHMYAHTLAYHHSVFRDRIRRIRRSIEKLLNRNKYVKILIKAPHTFFDKHMVNDFYADVYSHILHEEFAGLHGRVIYLNHRDITDALDNKDLHPDDTVVGAMINQMLSYVCEKQY